MNEPATFRVPAKTLAPTALSTGTDSPVRVDSSTLEAPEITSPSSGRRSPGLITIEDPVRISATGVGISSPPAITLAVDGASSRSDSTERRLLSSASSSRALPTANRTITHAASA